MTRRAAEHTLQLGEGDARISTTFLVQKAHLQLAGGGGFSVSRILIGMSKCRRGIGQARRSGPIGVVQTTYYASISWIPNVCTLKFVHLALMRHTPC